MRLTGKGYLMGVLASSLVISLYGVVKASPGAATVKQTPSTTQEQDGQRKPLRLSQSQEEVDAKSAGCQSCHTATDSVSLHVSQAVPIGGTDCHRGDPNVRAPHDLDHQPEAYQRAQRRLHQPPQDRESGQHGNP